MNLLQHYQQALLYNNWANHQILTALQTLENSPSKAVRIFAHIIGAEQLWYSRIVGDAKPDIWPDLSITQCTDALDVIVETWQRWVESLSDFDLRRRIAYVNSKGEPWSNTIDDIIGHVIHHASYHRGQIATVLAEAGHEPPYTDYIHALRQHYVEQPD